MATQVICFYTPIKKTTSREVRFGWQTAVRAGATTISSEFATHCHKSICKALSIVARQLHK
jgi:hypothetical protein